MTKAQVKTAIQSLGLSARCIDGEWRVAIRLEHFLAKGATYTEARERNEASAYYTTDAEDAMGTAEAMAATLG